MPVDFYKRVLELEKEVDKLKEKCTEPLLKGLTQLYSEAIEYFGYIDQVDRCYELQMRMQSILVKPYVLACLNRFEQERLEEEARLEEKNPNPKKLVVFQSTKRQLAKLHEKMRLDKERKDREEAKKRGDQVQEPESEEISESSEDEEVLQARAAAIADVDSIVTTPRVT